MNDEVAEEQLNLSLSLGKTKKRKRINHQNSSPKENLIIAGVLQARNRMLHQNTPIFLNYNSTNGLHLIRLLLFSAAAADRHDYSCAARCLLHLYPYLSLSGDPIQRVAAYFCDSILTTVLTPSPSYPSLFPSLTPEEELFSSTSLYRCTPYLQFGHFTANQAIMEVFEGEEYCNEGSLHVIDLDVFYGFQWPSLIQSLADNAKNDKRVKLRITGFGRSDSELKETEARLSSFASGFRNLNFEFEGKNREVSTLEDINLWENSTVVVNSVFNHDMLKGSTLQLMKSLSPSLVILVDKEGGMTEAKSRSFFSRFIESLQYFAAIFDSLDDCLPADSKERLKIEKHCLGREIRNTVNDEKKAEEGVLMKYGRFERWKEVMEESGFEGLMMSSRCVSQAKLLLKRHSHCCGLEEHGGGAGFRISERDNGRAISLGWHDRYLITATAWRCNSP